MFTSISLTIHNRTELSEYCINSILSTIPRDQFEFIVIDNGSENDTIEMLKRYDKHFDKLFLNHKNNLGSAINDAWKLADPNSEWLIVLDNDDFCMNGWFENFKLLTKSKLKPDVIYCQMRTPEFDKHTIKRVKNGGVYYLKHKTNWYGAGLAIKKSIVDKYNLRFVEGNEPWTGGSIYSHFGRFTNKLGLQIIHQAKPCILTQDCQYSNPEYSDYYKKVFSYKHRRGGKLAYKDTSKFESLRIRGGHIDNPDEYYEGSGYEIGKHYRKALNSKEGKDEFLRVNQSITKKELKELRAKKGK
jgi:glycosyltransferase involved in cell wall biosynthesis